MKMCLRAGALSQLRELWAIPDAVCTFATHPSLCDASVFSLAPLTPLKWLATAKHCLRNMLQPPPGAREGAGPLVV
jgi:hypothetical protein